MDLLWQELTLGLDSARLAAQMLIRMVLAMLLGGLVGMQREQAGKPAGVRTHMLVCTGTAIVIIAARLDGIPQSEMSKVIEGLVAGIGFLGGGVILKLSHEREIRGVTTAASIWGTAGIGIAVGLGQVWIGVVSMVVVWLILFVLGYLEKRVWGMDEDSA